MSPFSLFEKIQKMRMSPFSLFEKIQKMRMGRVLDKF
jgi:hypothetical protein